MKAYTHSQLNMVTSGAQRFEIPIMRPGLASKLGRLFATLSRKVKAMKSSSVTVTKTWSRRTPIKAYNATCTQIGAHKIRIASRLYHSLRKSRSERSLSALSEVIAFTLVKYPVSCDRNEPHLPFDAHPNTACVTNCRNKKVV